VYEIIADITDPRRPTTASAAIKRLETLRTAKDCSTPSFAKSLSDKYVDLSQKLKTSRNASVLEAANESKSRRDRAIKWIEDHINTTR
jgi:hypothetical protein